MLFALGLSKKVLLADNLAPYVDLIFNINSEGNQFTFGLFAIQFSLFFAAIFWLFRVLRYGTMGLAKCLYNLL